MEKAKTVVLIAGKEYTLSGYESEEYMHRVAIYVDRTMREITKAHGNLPTNMVAVLAALNIADELLRARGDTGSVSPPESAAALHTAGTNDRPDAAEAPEAGRPEEAGDEAQPQDAARLGGMDGERQADRGGQIQREDARDASQGGSPGADQSGVPGQGGLQSAGQGQGVEAAGQPAPERPYVGALTEDADTHRGDNIPDPEPFPIKPLRDQGQTPWRHRRF
jgi:cell division protein ZapA (FtsZ GTPase activity inhibitor)